MHIADGFLPPIWCIFWYVLSIPCVVYGITKIKKITEEFDEAKSLLAVSGAYMFIISFIPIPSPSGGCSHLTGNGLNGSIFGVAITSTLAAIVLIFQLFLLGHGGITTLGATIFAYGIVGPFVAWIIYNSIIKINFNSTIAIFFASFFGNLFTYITTSIQLGAAFPIPTFFDGFLKFLSLYIIVQLPLAIIEGLVSVFIWKSLKKYKFKLLNKLNLFGKNEI